MFKEQNLISLVLFWFNREVNVNSNVIVHMEGKQTTLETIKVQI